jgi:hypothetical protein
LSKVIGERNASGDRAKEEVKRQRMRRHGLDVFVRDGPKKRIAIQAVHRGGHSNIFVSKRSKAPRAHGIRPEEVLEAIL